MKFTLRFLSTLLASLFLAFVLVSCDENTTPTEPDPDVSAPTNLRAFADDGKVGLTWTASSSETATNFGSYELTFNESGVTTGAQIRSIQKGSTSYTVDGLTNGKRYNFIIRSKTTKGKTSTDYVNVEWSPAVRNSKDLQGFPIDVYETASTQPKSGLVFNGTSNKPEVLSQASADWKTRGDVFLQTDANQQILKLRSADLAVNNKGIRSVSFSDVSYNVNDLNGSSAQSAPPIATSYNLKEVSFIDQTEQNGKVHWIRIQGTGGELHTVRFLVKKVNGKLVQGTSPNRFISLEVSLQTTTGNPYAKR